MKKIVLLGVGGLFVWFFYAPVAFCHCEIPCGIYNDEMRFHMIEEHIATIEKSMQNIVELSKGQEKNYNQIVRWVSNKEEHADMIQEIVYQYFMTQRVKPVDDKNAEEYKSYVTQLTLLHKMLVFAMKTKQSTDLANVAKLKALLGDFSSAYFGQAKK